MNKFALILVSVFGLSMSTNAQVVKPVCINSLDATSDMTENEGPKGTLTVNWKNGTPPYTVTLSTVNPVVTADLSAAQDQPPFTNVTSPFTIPNLDPKVQYATTVTDSSTPAVSVVASVVVAPVVVVVAAAEQSPTPQQLQTCDNTLTISLHQTDASCTQPTGSIQIIAPDLVGTGITVTYTLTFPSGQTETNNTGIFTGLASGEYSVLVTAANGAQMLTGCGSISVCNNGITSSDNAIVNFIISKFCNGCIAP